MTPHIPRHYDYSQQVRRHAVHCSIVRLSQVASFDVVSNRINESLSSETMSIAIPCQDKNADVVGS